MRDLARLALWLTVAALAGAAAALDGWAEALDRVLNED